METNEMDWEGAEREKPDEEREERNGKKGLIDRGVERAGWRMEFFWEFSRFDQVSCSWFQGRKGIWKVQN